jgi:thiamine-phosphate pyrophosphorylase
VLATVARMLDGLDAAGDVAVVVRDKRRPVQDVAARCAALRLITARANALLFVHTHAVLVGPLGLDGLHLDGAADEKTVRTARLRLPPDSLLGVSRHIHDLREGILPALPGVDYALLSPIFRSPTKPCDARAPLGRGALRGHDVAVFALGGITSAEVGSCLRAGAYGVAVLGSVMSATDPRRAVVALLRAVSSASKSFTAQSNPGTILS